jgi:integrase
MSTTENGKSKYKSGSLHKRGKAGNYYLRYYVAGKQTNQRLMDSKSRSITDRRKAEKVARDLLAPLQHEAREDQQKAIAAKVQDEHGKFLDALEAQKPIFPLSKVWNAYKASGNRPRSGESTLNRYKATIDAFNLWMGEEFPDVRNMRDVALQHAEAYAAHLESKKLSPSSFNIYLNALSTVWATLAAKAGLEANPFAWDKATRSGIQRRNIRAEVAVRKKRPLTLDEVNSVIEIAKGDYRTLVIILACTGQRLVDCVKLQWREINFDNGVITLMPAKTANRTGKEVYIPLLPQLRGELLSKLHNGRYVLPDLVEAYDRSNTTISKNIRSIFNEAKINAFKDTRIDTDKAIAETGAHSFRHSFVRIARLSGIPDAIIRKITGHESIEMVDHYTEFDENMIASLAAQVGAKSLPASQEKEKVPVWVRENLESMTAKTWKTIRAEILESSTD